MNAPLRDWASEQSVPQVARWNDSFFAFFFAFFAPLRATKGCAQRRKERKEFKREAARQKTSAGRSVSRVLFRAGWRGDGHFSSRPVARPIQQPTRESSRAGPALLPYLALLRVGFAEPACRQAAGALLPHLFTLTLSSKRSPAISGGMLSVALSLSFAGTFRASESTRLGRWALPTTLSFGARTFLSLPDPHGGRSQSMGSASSGRPIGRRTRLLYPNGRAFFGSSPRKSAVEPGLGPVNFPGFALPCPIQGS